jgi:hypothetical protein
MTKLELPEQEREMQKWHPILTAALAPVYLKHFLSRADYAGQLDDFATQIQAISYNPDLTDEEKFLKLNTLDQRVILGVNAAVAHQTYLAVNAILQKSFPEIYAAHMPQVDPPESSAVQSTASRSVTINLGETREGDGQVQ